MDEHELIFTGVISKEGKTYSALCLELDVASQGDTPESAKDYLLEAATLYLETAIENNLPYLRPVPQDQDPRHSIPDQVVATFPVRIHFSIAAYA